MGHVPHLFVERPWPEGSIDLADAVMRHLTVVLRLGDGTVVSYTDGEGCMGAGLLTSIGIKRGAEKIHSRPRPAVHVVSAPPRSKDRQRFLVEKVAELGAASVAWLTGTRFGGGRPPRNERCQAWADSALEQSRGAFRTMVGIDPIDVGGIDSAALVADHGGSSLPRPLPSDVTIVIGPEGGWAPQEVPYENRRVALSTRVLRVETAAIVAVGQMMHDAEW